MKKKCSIMKILSLIGCIAAMFLLTTPAVSAGIIYPAPYSTAAIPEQFPVNNGPFTGLSGSLVRPREAIPSYIPLAPAAGIIDYPTGTLYPVNSIIVNPAMTGLGSFQQTFGSYYTGSRTRSSGSRSSGARFMCSL